MSNRPPPDEPMGPTERPKALLCIDPAYAGKTGLAYFQRGIGDYTLSHYGFLLPHEARSDARYVWLRRIKKAGGTLVIEDAHFQKNVLTLKRMVEAKCWWTVAAMDAGFSPEQIIEVQPQQWQSAVQRGWKFGKKSAKDIGVIQQYVKHRWGVDEPQPDALSAICLGTWAIDMKGAL